jgi:hypothetical protein
VQCSCGNARDPHTASYSLTTDDSTLSHYLLGFVAIAYAEDVLNIDGVWWQMRFTGTDGPKGVIVPSKIDTWTWTRRDE